MKKLFGVICLLSSMILYSQDSNRLSLYSHKNEELLLLEIDNTTSKIRSLTQLQCFARQHMKLKQLAQENAYKYGNTYIKEWQPYTIYPNDQNEVLKRAYQERDYEINRLYKYIRDMKHEILDRRIDAHRAFSSVASLEKQVQESLHLSENRVQALDIGCLGFKFAAEYDSMSPATSSCQTTNASDSSDICDSYSEVFYSRSSSSSIATSDDYDEVQFLQLTQINKKKAQQSLEDKKRYEKIREEKQARASQSMRDKARHLQELNKINFKNVLKQLQLTMHKKVQIKELKQQSDNRCLKIAQEQQNKDHKQFLDNCILSLQEEKKFRILQKNKQDSLKLKQDILNLMNKEPRLLHESEISCQADKKDIEQQINANDKKLTDRLIKTVVDTYDKQIYGHRIYDMLVEIINNNEQIIIENKINPAITAPNGLLHVIDTYMKVSKIDSEDLVQYGVVQPALQYSQLIHLDQDVLVSKWFTGFEPMVQQRGLTEAQIHYCKEIFTIILTQALEIHRQVL